MNAKGFRSKRPYRWTLVCSLIILIPTSILKLSFLVSLLAFSAWICILFVTIKDVVVDEKRFLVNYPFALGLTTVNCSWKEIKEIRIILKNVLEHGIRNASRIYLFLKNDQKINISFHATNEEIEIIKSIAQKNLVEVTVKGFQKQSS